MRELFNVYFNPDGSFRMKMANGFIDVPSTQGCYAISTGCGSGKTECCKSIIRQRANEGILYCVDTIAELDKMYNWIAQNANELGIGEHEVIIISSDKRHDCFLKQYQNNPEILMYKKIVLITHVRFWTDLINYFLIYNPKSQVDEFDGDFHTLLQRADLRRFVIFDETPNYVKPFFTMSRSQLSGFGYQENDVWKVYNPTDIKKVYNKFFKGCSDSPFPKGDHKIDRIKRDVIFNLIPRYFNQWINENSTTHSITFSPINLYQPNIRTHILILEGAANVLFHNSKYFRILDIKKKYNGKVNFQRFDFTLKRRTTLLDEAAYNTSFSHIEQGLQYCCQQGQKSLVVVWKSHGKNNRNTEDSRFYERVRSDFYKTNVSSGMYDIIYYGSPQSKSTNEFKDYDNIFLCGDWNITNEETAKFNSNFGMSLSSTDLKLWTFIQLICRIKIRMHNGTACNVFYSSDFDNKFIGLLEDYFQNLNTFLNINPNLTPYPEWLMNKLRCVRKDYWDDISSLVKWNGRIERAIKDGTAENIDVELGDLINIVPRKNKKKREYDNIRRILSDTFHITLNIV